MHCAIEIHSGQKIESIYSDDGAVMSNEVSDLAKKDLVADSQGSESLASEFLKSMVHAGVEEPINRMIRAISELAGSKLPELDLVGYEKKPLGVNKGK